MKLSDLPALLQPLEGGLFAGVCTTPDGAHHAVVLLADKPDEKLTWKQAMNWAEKLGAVLPTRPVAALLFANTKAQFEPEWHWTSESFDGSYAWDQNFFSGIQSNGHKSYEGRARAVRLIQLTP
jgi:hypothetical protein